MYDDQAISQSLSMMAMEQSPRFYNGFAAIGSFGAGSFKNQFYPGCSPGTLLGPLDVPDLKYGFNNPSGMSYDQGSLRRLLSSSLSQKDSGLGGNYACCGIILNDLHALVEHFEEHHVVVVDPPTMMPPTQMQTVQQQAPSQIQPQPQASTSFTSMHQPSQPQQLQSVIQNQQLQQQPLRPSLELDIETIDTMDDMDMEEDSSSSHSSHDGHSPTYSGTSTPSLSPPLTPILPFDTTSIRRPHPLANHLPHPPLPSSRPPSPRLIDAFNRYAGYTEFSAMLPGTMGIEGDMMIPGHMRQKSKGSKGCLPPSLLTTPSQPSTPRSLTPNPTASCSSSSTPATPTTTSSGNPILSSKPFTCPTPGCSKSYKQSNGLKYHIQHGSCNFAPRDLLLATLPAAEQERRMKPYVCQVPPCTRRYKNMNGLRYHYMHSGAHGAIGLGLLAQGGGYKGDLGTESKAATASSASYAQHPFPYQQQLLQHQNVDVSMS